MTSLPERIMAYADAKPESTPIQADDLLQLCDRAAVSRALPRLALSARLCSSYGDRCVRGPRARPAYAAAPRFGPTNDQ